MSYNLSDMMDSQRAYTKLFKQLGYKADGTGVKPWSNRVVDADGNAIEFRASEWVYSGAHGSMQGVNATDLQLFLFDKLDKSKLIELLAAKDC